jgi:hypothetical protein
MIWGVLWVETNILDFLQTNRIGGFVQPAGTQDCSLAGKMSVIRLGPSNPLTQSAATDTDKGCSALQLNN